MRYRVSRVAFALAFVGLACSDAPTTTSIRPFDGLAQHTVLEDFIQAAIDTYLPKGFEAAVEARWSTVKNKKNSGDMAGAIQQLNALSLWIDKKTGDITIPGSESVTKEQAAAVIVVNMARWVYDGAAADPQIIPTGDVAIEIVPAGGALAMVVPSRHAAVSWSAGTTAEERIIVISEDPGNYPAICQGPLPTNRCQYPLFYKIESFPHQNLLNPGNVEVCLVTTGDRRSIEYQNEEEDGPVHQRTRLAHNRPTNPANYTPGGTIDGDIEILPLVAPEGQASGLAECEEHSDVGLRGLEKAVHSVMHLAGRLIAPKNAYAYDQGPMHRFLDFSNFNAVDPTSGADLAIENVQYNPGTTGTTSTPRSLNYQIANRSRRAEDGDATATAVGVIARAYISSNSTLEATEDFLLGSASLGNMLPDGTPQPVGHTGFELPFEGPVYLIVTVEQTGGLAEVSMANNTYVLNLNPPVQDGDGSDQSHTFNTGTSYSCNAMSLVQSFTPSALSLGRVDLLLRAGGSMPTGGYSSVINIRSGSPGGTVIGTSTASVPFATTGTETWVQYMFPNPVATTPETLYYIEWVSPDAATLSWMGSSTDTYAAGQAFGCANVVPLDYDYNFKTFPPAPIQ